MTSFENIVENGQMGRKLAFSYSVFNSLTINSRMILSSKQNSFKLDKSKILSSGKGLTLSQTSPGFYICFLLKTLWEKEKLLFNKQFPLIPQYFLPIWKKLSAVFIKFELSSANSLSLEQYKCC